MKNYVVVSHKYTSSPDDDLVAYLIGKKSIQSVLHITHSFSSRKDRISYLKWYRNGLIHKEKKSINLYGYPEPLIYIKELFYTWYWILSSRLIIDYYIGLDGLCVLFGNIFPIKCKLKKTIFWAIDFVPIKRYETSLKNYIYKKVNSYGYSRSDYMWDLSPRMAPARKKYHGISKYKNHMIVPYGVWTKMNNLIDYSLCNKYMLVFMGHISENSGVQFVIRAIPDILKIVPNFKFRVIGDGPYLSALKEQAEGMGVYQSIDFCGKIDDYNCLKHLICESALAIAPYPDTDSSFTKFADPGKIKTYLGCGLPVLLTEVPWNAEEIQANQCGEIVSLNSSSLSRVVGSWICDEGKMIKGRNNAIRYSNSFDYELIFNRAIKRINGK